MVVSQTIASGQVEYFVIKPELFVALAGRMPDQLDAPLHDFLALRPDDAVPTVSTAGNPAADAGLAEEVGARLDTFTWALATTGSDSSSITTRPGWSTIPSAARPTPTT